MGISTNLADEAASTGSASVTDVDIASSQGKVSTLNSTAGVLDAGLVFTGTGEDVSDFKSIGINVIAPHASATDGMTFQFSSDNVNWDKVHSFTLSAATATFYNIPVEAQYFRVVFTNGGTLQTYFRLQVIYHATMTKESTLRLSDDIVGESAAQLGRVVITGKVGTNIFRNVTLDAATSVLPTLPYETHEINQGNMFSFEEKIDLAINHVYDIQITTPNTTKWSHFLFAFSVESETEWWFWEDVNIILAGAAVTTINRNRNSATVPTLTIKVIENDTLVLANADTAVAGATSLAHGIAGAGRDAGSADRADKIILKQNEDYTLRFEATAAGYISWILKWYEHIDED